MIHASLVHGQQVDLVNVHTLDSTITVDLKYATADNFMGEVLYEDGRCFLRLEVAVQLAHAHHYLQTQGLGLKVFDCYRPLSVQKRMFERFPQPGFVADPQRGSNHNRGAAVDVGLVNREGEEQPMPSAYDEFSERSHIQYRGASETEIQNRNVLQQAMIRFGFKPLETEWWHFNAPQAQEYAVLDIPIQELP